jgi:predicted RNA-binding Zn-ribbon protein involved in translation (DUF1610 family)
MGSDLLKCPACGEVAKVGVTVSFNDMPVSENGTFKFDNSNYQVDSYEADLCACGETLCVEDADDGLVVRVVGEDTPPPDDPETPEHVGTGRACGECLSLYIDHLAYGGACDVDGETHAPGEEACPSFKPKGDEVYRRKVWKLCGVDIFAPTGGVVCFDFPPTHLQIGHRFRYGMVGEKDLREMRWVVTARKGDMVFFIKETETTRPGMTMCLNPKCSDYGVWMGTKNTFGRCALCNTTLPDLNQTSIFNVRAPVGHPQSLVSQAAKAEKMAVEAMKRGETVIVTLEGVPDAFKEKMLEVLGLQHSHEARKKVGLPAIIMKDVPLEWRDFAKFLVNNRGRHPKVDILYKAMSEGAYGTDSQFIQCPNCGNNEPTPVRLSEEFYDNMVYVCQKCDQGGLEAVVGPRHVMSFDLDADAVALLLKPEEGDDGFESVRDSPAEES